MSQSTIKVSRRTLFAGAGSVVGLAAVATLLPSVQGDVVPASAQPKPAPEKGGGYTLSDHVKQYYKTTLV